ncbi:target of SBF [Sporothrix curviconia]|uniref:Target of SBF n=1 Tax=Sporothrix curviconia TaxID=1260050 RepID=A0ABP0C2B7_9PEZI
MDSPFGSKASEPSLPQVAGVKRPAPSLLPAFEPLSSSPGLPRLVKKARGNTSSLTSKNAYAKYPTPVPTSSTGIMSSSPPARVAARPALQRTLSAASERTPLCIVPSIELNENGETLLMGRSSNSSHYQLSANRLISRVHAKARYVPSADPLEPNKVEIICCGWNGLKLHCQGRTWDLSKGDTFTSETENAELMLDVQDARVRIQWPKRSSSDSLATLSDSSWDSPQSARMASRQNNRGGAPGAPGGSALQSSPLRRAARIASPESPTPVGVPISGASLQALLSQHMGSEDEDDDNSGAAIQIYEDASGDDEPELPKQDANAGVSFATELVDSFSSDLSDIHSDDDANDNSQNDVDADDDPDEENDPIVHSFGPFGANLSDRLASFSTNSPKVVRPPLSRISSAESSMTSFVSDVSGDAAREGDSIHVKGSSTRPTTPRAAPGPQKEVAVDRSPDRSAEGVGLGITVAAPASPVQISSNVDIETVRNHLINQLAFSRLSSSPLSTIMNNLPAEERRDLTPEGLRLIIEGTACVGVIKRQGKDAAGKALESEYYYVSDMDDDVSRRSVVDGLRKPSLRNCRKQHKQYYWKRPRTP